MGWLKRLFQGGEDDQPMPTPTPAPEPPAEDTGMETPSELPPEGTGGEAEEVEE